MNRVDLIAVTDDKGFITLHEPDEDGGAGDLVAAIYRDDWLPILTAPTPTASSEVDREAVARIIDPSVWAERDYCAGRREAWDNGLKFGWRGMEFEDWVERGTGPSLAKADAILALLQPTGNSRAESGK